jgi:hypothetical protein
MKKIIFATVIILALATISFADIPKTLNYQGRLMNSVGQPVIDGQYSVTFRLYTAASGGTQVWEEAQSVMANNGYFNTVLGNAIALTPAMFSQAVWIGIQVGAEAEMTPRQKLGTVAYAMTVVDGAITTDKLADGAVTASKLKGEIQTGQILDNAITTEKIKDGEIKNNDLAVNAVTTEKMSANAITNIWTLTREPSSDDHPATSYTDVKDAEIDIETTGGTLLVITSYSFMINEADEFGAVHFKMRVDPGGYLSPGNGYKQKIRDQNGRYVFQAGGFSTVISGVPAGSHTVKLQWKKTDNVLICMKDDTSYSITVIELKR